MARKKPEKAELSIEEQALVRRVDEMMSTDPLPETPELSEKLLKSIKVDETDESSKPTPILKIASTMKDVPQPEKPETPIDLPIPEEAVSDVPTGMDDTETDKAVDDIVAKEGDTVLALEDAKNKRNQLPVDRSWKDKLQGFVRSKRFWIVLLVILGIFFVVPLTRYTVLGLVWEKPVNLRVVDSKTATPVSNAVVVVDGKSVKTDADGKVHVNAGLGKQTVKVAKQYYQPTTADYFVGFKAGQDTTVKLIATGRLVPITVVNRLSGKPLAGVQIKILNTIAKTDAKGKATVGVPVGKDMLAAQLSLKGYNTTVTSIKVTDGVVPQNTLEMTPAGRVYFLSNATGKLDVVKTNLDGTERKTVLAGTGKEELSTTSLLATRDWRYLVLKSRRDTPQAALYLIDTATDKVTVFDSSGSDFTLVGWDNHNFVYKLARTGQSETTAGSRVLKSYDADHQQLNQLDQNLAGGTGTDYSYQDFSNFYLVDGVVTYTAQWFGLSAKNDAEAISGKNNVIRTIQSNGQGKKDHQAFSGVNTSIQATLYEPQEVYYAVYDYTSAKTTYYEYQDKVVKAATIDQSTFDAAYPTYLQSPSGSQTFWAELRDGKNTLFTGDANAGNKKQIATLSDYTPYGWYSDDYTMVSKSASELYIMPAKGRLMSKPPVKITDYYKPAQTYQGYGGGYGGL